jgi:uncharacterized protein (DUF2236 family)
MDRMDDGYFGPGSVSWTVWGHPHIAIAGLRGSIVAVLDLAGAAGVDQHSDYRQDPLGRVQRSNVFFIATVFGDTRMARKAGNWLMGMPRSMVPATPETVQDYLHYARTEIMALTDQATQTLIDFFIRPPLAPAWPMTPINPFLRIAARAAVSTLSDDVLELCGPQRDPVRDDIANALVRRALNAATLASHRRSPRHRRTGTALPPSSHWPWPPRPPTRAESPHEVCAADL